MLRDSQFDKGCLILNCIPLCKKPKRDRFCPTPSLPMNRKSFFPPSPVMLKFFLCEEKLQTLCSNSTQTALYLAVRVKKNPHCKCSWQLKQEADVSFCSELPCLLLFLNSVLAAGQQTAPVCENCVFPGWGAERRKGKKRVKFWKSERGSQNVEISSASGASCVWCIRDFPSSISKHRSPIILVGVQRLAAAFQGEIAASSITSPLGLTLFQQVLEWKQDFAARGRKKKKKNP